MRKRKTTLPLPADILRRIKKGAILRKNMISKLDHNAILDRIDGDDAYRARWEKCKGRIDLKWDAVAPDPVAKALAGDIRRESFLSVSEATAQHEISSYVSDDFDLIGRCAILKLDDSFVEFLWDTYCMNEIPMPGGD